MRRKASGAEEEIRGNRRNLPESKNTEREERKRQKLWLVWEGRNTSSRPNLASIKQYSKCGKCGKYNHYASCCRTGAQGDQERANQEDNKG